MHPLQVQYIHDVLQKRLYESEKPLVDLFKSLRKQMIVTSSFLF